MKLLCHTFIIFCALYAKAQITFEKTYGTIEEEQANAVTQTSDNGYLLAGYAKYGKYCVYLIKTNEQGDTIWTRLYDYYPSQNAVAVTQTGDGYLLTGQVYPTIGGGSNSCIYLLRIYEQGDTLWTRAISGDHDLTAEDIQKTFDGGYVIAGHTSSYGAGDDDFYLIRTDSNGDTLWTRTYGRWNREEAYDMQQTADGGFILAGTRLVGTKTDVYLVKTDANGNMTSISEDKDYTVKDFNLSQNYPNPFNPTTNLEFRIPNSGFVSLKIYDVLGREMADLVNQKLTVGRHIIQWNASGLASGIYYYNLYFDDKNAGTRKMLYLK